MKIARRVIPKMRCSKCLMPWTRMKKFLLRGLAFITFEVFIVVADTQIGLYAKLLDLYLNYRWNCNSELSLNQYNELNFIFRFIFDFNEMNLIVEKNWKYTKNTKYNIHYLTILEIINWGTLQNKYLKNTSKNISGICCLIKMSLFSFNVKSGQWFKTQKNMKTMKLESLM